MATQRIDTRGLNALQVEVAMTEGDTINSFLDGVDRGINMVDKVSAIQARSEEQEIRRTRNEIFKEQLTLQKQRQNFELAELNRMRQMEQAFTEAISGAVVPAGTPVPNPSGGVSISSSTVTAPGVAGPVTGPVGIPRVISAASRLKPYIEASSRFKSPVIASETAKLNGAVEQAKRTKVKIEGISASGFADGDITFERLAQIVNLDNQEVNDAIFASLQSKNGLSQKQAKDFMVAARTAVLDGLVPEMDPGNMPTGFVPAGTPIAVRELTTDQAAMMRDFLNERVDVLQQAIDSGRFNSEQQINAAKTLVAQKMQAVRHNRGMLEGIAKRMRELESAENADPSAMESLVKEAEDMGAVARIETKSVSLPHLDEIVFWTDGIDPGVIPEAMVRTAVDPNAFPGLVGTPQTETAEEVVDRPTSTAERNAEVNRLLGR